MSLLTGLKFKFGDRVVLSTKRRADYNLWAVGEVMKITGVHAKSRTYTIDYTDRFLFEEDLEKASWDGDNDPADPEQADWSDIND